MFLRLLRHRNFETRFEQSVISQSLLCLAENALFILVLGLLDATHKENKGTPKEGDIRQGRAKQQPWLSSLLLFFVQVKFRLIYHLKSELQSRVAWDAVFDALVFSPLKPVVPVKGMTDAAIEDCLSHSSRSKES